MTNQRVLDHALHLMGEDPAAGDIGDYLHRAPALLCDACRALAAADRLCRSAAGMEEQVLPGGDAYGLEEDFPLCDALLPAAALYVASGLVFDENPALSERFYGRFSEAVTACIGAIPASVESIANKY